MDPHRQLIWLAWTLTGLALGAQLSGWGPGLPVAMALITFQGAYLTARARRAGVLSVQVRAAYLGLLLLGTWPPLRGLHAAQLLGTAILVVFDYCLLARLLSLLHWNRRGPLTLARFRATFLSRPVQGSIVEQLDHGDTVLRRPFPGQSIRSIR